MSSYTLNAYRAFVLALAIWGGAGLFETIAGHFAWWSDPGAFVRQAPKPAGWINAWIPLTLLLMLAVMAAGAGMWRYRGEGRRGALATFGATILILVATFGWFIPQLGLMGGGTLDEAQLAAHSRAWILLNAVRLALVLATVWWGLVLLGRFEPRGGA